MAGAINSGLLSQREYDAVIRALSATVKGRAFLRELAERSRPEETRNLLQAVRQIEASLSVVREQLLPGKIALELNRIAEEIRKSSDNPDIRDRAISDLTRLAGDLMRMEAKQTLEIDKPL